VTEDKRYLHLGCGEEKIADALNVDISPDVGADVVCDLNVMPWPFSSGAYEQVIAQDIIEHLDDPLAFMAEAWRVLIPGGVVSLRTPRFNCENSWRDPTHKHHLHEDSFDYFDPDQYLGKKYPFYTKVKFRILKKCLSQDGTIELLMEKIA
jgi:SAM-dependent methyltransferase